MSPATDQMKKMSLGSWSRHLLLSTFISIVPSHCFAIAPVLDRFYPCDEYKHFSPDMQALYEAVNADNTQVALTALGTVTDVNYCTPTPVLRLVDIAIIHRNVPLVRSLLEKGAVANCSGKCRSAMLYVIDQPNSTERMEIKAIEIAELLLKYGGSLNDLNYAPYSSVPAPRGSFCSPVSCAVRNGSIKTIEWLLNHGASVEGERRDFWTPLEWTAQLGYLDIANMLLDHGANPNGLKNQAMFFGSPLIHAASGAQPEMTSLLISRGADVNRIIHSGGKSVTALKWARMNVESPSITAERKERLEKVIQILKTAGARE